MDKEKEKQNTRFLLFANLSVSPEKALLYLNDMEQNPHKITKYNLVASRISGNDNSIFPDRLEIDDFQVIYYKGTLIGYRKSVVTRANIASVHIGSGLLFADIVIETTGGRTIRAQGFKKSDARNIMELLS